MQRRLTLHAFALAVTAAVVGSIAYVALRGIMSRPKKHTPHLWSMAKHGECYCRCGWRRMTDSDHSYIYQHTVTDRKRKSAPDHCRPMAGR